MTLRELDWMAKGKLSAQWDQTAELLAMIANTSMARKPGSKAISSSEMHPFRQKPKPQATRISFDQAMKIFPGG